MPRQQIPDPQKRLWSGLLPGEDFGTIFSGHSLDLETNTGKVGLADSYSDLVNSSQGGFSGLTTPIAFVRSSADGTDRYWSNSGVLFKTSGANPTIGWAADAIASSPSAPLYDLIDFLGALICPISTDLSRLSGGVWTASWWQGTLAQAAMGANPHRFGLLAGGLMITDGRFIHDWDNTIARTNALTLPTGFTAKWIVTFGSLAFIGGSVTSGEAYIYTWDRINLNYLNRYPIGDNEALCGFVIDTLYIVTKKGMLKRFNGIGFQTEAQFPTVEAQQQITSIHPNGVSVIEHVAKIMVNFGAISNTRLVSGIWNFDAKTKNLYPNGSVRNTSAKDYAQSELADVGAIKFTAIGQGIFLIGAQVYTNYPGTTVYGIFNSDENNTQNQGYFVTAKLRATNVGRFWKIVFPIMKEMTSGGDRLRVAEKHAESSVLPAYETITWLSVSTFSATNANIAAGDFVEILAGDNGGAIARIVTYTGGVVTIDRSLFSSTKAARVRYLRFADLGTISNQVTQTGNFYPTVRSPWIQFLVEMRGTRTSPQIESLLLDFKDYKQVV